MRARRLHPEMTMFMCLLRTAAQKNGFCTLLGLPTGSERLDGLVLDGVDAS